MQKLRVLFILKMTLIDFVHKLNTMREKEADWDNAFILQYPSGKNPEKNYNV